jgi:phosphatidylserine/phosphatidylglycerophosphate/cardiolipin synthase-like enzyme
MAEFLSTGETAHYIEKLIKNAKESICFITPTLKLSDPLYQKLLAASQRGVKLIFVFGKEELSNSNQHQLASLKDLHMYFYHKLNAKCYFNENEMIFTSMNLHEYTESDKFEMGVYISKENDFQIFRKAIDQTNAIIQQAEKR